MNTDSCDRMMRVDVAGKDLERWSKLRTSLFDAITRLLDTVVIESTSSTVRNESQRAVSAVLEHFHARLQRASSENARIEAEVNSLYAQCERSLAEARKTNAEAAEIEFGTSVKRLNTALRLSRILAASDDENSTLVISSQMEKLLGNTGLMLREEPDPPSAGAKDT